MPNSKPLFPLGQIVATPGALTVLEAANVNAAQLLNRHVTGDWGTIYQEDRGLNEQAIKDGSRILSVYPVGDQVVWAITEADRSSTCLLLPDEY
ncbi:hypothetical protein CA51_21090 [Rosistilla oblonga]|uniref:hypothetical protein n=1 Tax=Rosistilla oblonga TaxID=2527990 RepID=UPI00118B0280|nr:hypothetical protein [Rosistilla oblonga]QDV12228.1 hypothetical protein CA51_21090 [Rosistilla oblonga]